MSQDLNVIKANVQQIENLGDTVYVSTTSNGVSINQQTVVKRGSQAVNKNSIRSSGGDVFQWEIQNIQKSTVSTTASHIKYTMQFAIEMKTDKSNCGHYWMDRNFIYFQKMKYTGTGPNETISYEPVKVLCTTAMNSLFPIQEATIVYGNLQDTETNVFRNHQYQQIYLPEDFQTTMNDQWFEGKSFIIDEFVIPYDEASKVLLPSATAWGDAHKNAHVKKVDTKFYWVFYKEFRIPLNMLHRLFNFSNNFFTAALYRDNMQLQVKLQQYSMAKCFGTETLFDTTNTGICEFELILLNKNSERVQNQVQSKTVIVQNQIGIDVSPLATAVKDLQEKVVTIGHTSVNAISNALLQYDQTEADSTYFHQRFTPFKAATILKREQQRLDNIINASAGKQTDYTTQLQQQDFAFFSDFNIMRGDASTLFYTSNLVTLESFRKEILRSTNSIQQYDRGLSPAFYSYFDWLCKYAFTFTNLEMFSMDEPSHDVIRDGYNSSQNRIIMRYSIKEYRNGEPKELTTDTCLDMNKDFNTLQVLVYQFYDLQMRIDVKQGTLLLGENYIQSYSE
ncbi:Conserved_hypothetical protein [Hexamita inflata]|uniref:Major capsid protein n=1 Tax=Hexamita inflata TaxID=28002 RepID=A0AA86N5K0_9EUKA|nr:Conserved hypothetical protein [Hexamita inflata]